MLIQRGDSARDVPVQAVAVAVAPIFTIPPSEALVTAAITKHGKLRLGRWSYTEDASRVRLLVEKTTDREVRQISIAPVWQADGFLVVAAVGANGGSSVSHWESSHLKFLGDAPGVPGSNIRVASYTTTDNLSGYVTALRDSDGRLRLDEWVVVDNQPVRRGHFRGDRIDSVELATSTTFPASFIVFTLHEGTVEVLAFESLSAQPSKRFEVHHVKRMVGTVANVPFDFNIRHFARAFLAVENESGDLEAFLDKDRSATWKAVSKIAACSAGATFGLANDVTGVRRHDDHLEMICWSSGASGPPKRGGQASGGPIKDIALVGSILIPDLVVSAARLANDDLELTAWKLRPPPIPTRVTFTKLHCIQTTDDQGSPSDEPYVVFFTINLTHPSMGKLKHTGVFGGVDEVSSSRTQHLRLWGENHFEAIDPTKDDVLVLLAVMESDDSDAADVISAASQAMRVHAADIAGSNTTRANKVSQLKRTLRKALLRGAETGIFESDDDLIGDVRELDVNSHLSILANFEGGLEVPIDVRKKGEHGEYLLSFLLQAQRP